MRGRRDLRWHVTLPTHDQVRVDAVSRRQAAEVKQACPDGYSVDDAVTRSGVQAESISHSTMRWSSHQIATSAWSGVRTVLVAEPSALTSPDRDPSAGPGAAPGKSGDLGDGGAVSLMPGPLSRSTELRQLIDNDLAAFGATVIRGIDPSRSDAILDIARLIGSSI